MKYFINGFISILFCGSCMNRREVIFVYCNVSGNKIRVDNVDGMPPGVTPGVLVPVHDENDTHEEAILFFSEAARIQDRIKIVWQESGTSHELEVNRGDLGLPAVLKQGKIRFTYVGEGKWRIRLLKI